MKLIKGAQIINEQSIFKGSVLINDQKIEKIIPPEKENELGQIFLENTFTIDANDKYLMPGVIDDQVHFREPGLTHKGSIYTESKAAVAGGITSFMEMPNTNPKTTTFELLEEKFEIASSESFANYSFYFGAANDNSHLISQVDVKHTCGIKVFMGSSTGNMLVDDPKALETIFKEAQTIVAIHSEDETIVQENLKMAKEEFGTDIPFSKHPEIRSRKACLSSTKKAIDLAKRNNTRLHVLHISTKDELALFSNQLPLSEKRITAEACVHHLYFTDNDYKDKKQFIKWNPAIKTAADREAIFNAVLDGTIDVIATDHAPHTLEEKSKSYLECPSGGPLVQHSLLTMLDFYEKGDISLERIVQMMCHHPAELFKVHKRGYIREGYFADIVLIDPHKVQVVKPDNLLYKCGWSPFMHHTFLNSISHTFVNGALVYENGKILNRPSVMALNFDR